LENPTWEVTKRPQGIEIPAVYMYASQRALVFPALFSMDKEDISFLTSGHYGTIESYFERCGLDAALFVPQVIAAGCDSLEHHIESHDEWVRLRAVFKAIFPSVLDRASSESILVAKYLDQLRLPLRGNIGLVDIGWMGSMQEAFEKLAALSGRNYSVTGYYIGMHAGAEQRTGAGRRMKGYLTNLGKPEDINQWIQEGIELIDFLFLAPHGSCLGYVERAGAIEPFLEDNPLEAENTAKAQRVQMGVIDYITAVQSLIRECPRLQLDTRGALFPFAQVIREPTKAEAELLGDLTHVLGFGKSERLYIARPPERQTRHLNGSASASGSRAKPYAPFWEIGYAKRTGKLVG
jgi:hypothetical protein